jgi:hypothetical protein
LVQPSIYLEFLVGFPSWAERAARLILPSLSDNPSVYDAAICEFAYLRGAAESVKLAYTSA